MALDNAKNFAKVTLATGITSSATSISLTAGHGARLPAVPFNATIWNSTDYPDPADDTGVEIVRVTNRVTDTLTVTRAQESTSASAHNTSGKTYKLLAGITAKIVNTDLNAEFSALAAADTALDSRVDALEAAGPGEGGNYVAKYPQVYDARDYLPNDGTTDATAALQALIDEIGTNKKNAIIELDDIDYVIGGALQEGSRRNAQIIIPSVGITERQYSITIRGQTTIAFSPSGYEPIEIPRGARLKSTLAAGTGSDPSVISGRGPVGGYLDETNYLKIRLENLIVTTVPNPSYSAINFRRFTSVYFRDVLVVAGNWIDVPHVTAPTTATSYGVILPQFNSGVMQHVEGELNAFGFYTGIRGGELMHCEQLGAWACQVGLELPFSHHISQIERFLLFWSPTGIRWTAAHPIDLQEFAIERTMASETGWFKSVYEIDDLGNLGVGDVVWWNVEASLGAVDSIYVRGATNLNYRRLGTVAAGGPSAEPPPIETGIWKWTSSTAGPVVSYEVGIDNATPTSATVLSIAKFSDTDFDASELFARLGSGDDVTLRDRNNSDKWIRYDITGAGTDAGVYWTFPINDSNSNTPTFVSGAQLFVTFTYGGSGSVPPSGLLYDTFSGTNGTLLQDHTPDIGPAWTKIEGGALNAVIQDGYCQAASTSSAVALSYIRDAGVADVTISADMTMMAVTSGQHYMELLLRAVDSNNHISGKLFDLATNNLAIVKHEAGADTVIAAVTFAITAATVYHFSLTASGSSISLDVNGTVVSGSSSFNSTVTTHGFRVFNADGSAQSRLDNHMVESALIRPA